MRSTGRHHHLHRVHSPDQVRPGLDRDRPRLLGLCLQRPGSTEQQQEQGLKHGRGGGRGRGRGRGREREAMMFSGCPCGQGTIGIDARPVLGHLPEPGPGPAHGPRLVQLHCMLVRQLVVTMVEALERGRGQGCTDPGSKQGPALRDLQAAAHLPAQPLGSLAAVTAAGPGPGLEPGLVLVLGVEAGRNSTSRATHYRWE